MRCQTQRKKHSKRLTTELSDLMPVALEPIDIPAKRERLRPKSDSVAVDYMDNGVYVASDNTACYAGVRIHLGHRSLRCRPFRSASQYSYAGSRFHDGTSALTAKEFIQWVRLCKRHGLIPKTAKVKRKGKQNILELVKPELYDRHVLFSALCCYRFSEVKPGMIWQLLQHMKARPKPHFWQAFHYAITRHWPGGAHNFVAMGIGRIDFAEACGCQMLFEKGTIRQRRLNSMSTQTAVANAGREFQGMSVSKPSDVLQPCWKPLFTTPKPTKTELHRIYNEGIK